MRVFIPHPLVAALEPQRRQVSGIVGSINSSLVAHWLCGSRQCDRQSPTGRVNFLKACIGYTPVFMISSLLVQPYLM